MVFGSALALPKPQEPPTEEVENPEQAEPAQVEEAAPAASTQLGESQLSLALKLSGAKPQAVSASSYGGRRRRSPQDAEEEQKESEPEESAPPAAEGDAAPAQLGESQLSLALKLSGAKPQAVSASSYGGRRWEA